MDTAQYKGKYSYEEFAAHFKTTVDAVKHAISSGSMNPDIIEKQQGNKPFKFFSASYVIGLEKILAGKPFKPKYAKQFEKFRITEYLLILLIILKESKIMKDKDNNEEVKTDSDATVTNAGNSGGINPPVETTEPIDDDNAGEVPDKPIDGDNPPVETVEDDDAQGEEVDPPKVNDNSQSETTLAKYLSNVQDDNPQSETLAKNFANVADIKIDEEFRRLIPPLSDDEFAQLEENVLAYGIQDAIKTWGGVIVDGHNRYTIATKHNLPFNTVEMDFESRDDVIIWIIQNQFGRRNLSIADRADLATKLEPLFAAKAKARQGKRNDLNGNKESEKPKTSRENKASYQAAKAAGISDETLRQYKAVKKNGTPEINNAMRSGETSINQAFKTTKEKNKKYSTDKEKPKVDSDRKKAQKTAEKLYLDAEEFLNFLTDKNFPADLIKDFHNIKDDFADFMEELKEYAVQAKTE